MVDPLRENSLPRYELRRGASILIDIHQAGLPLGMMGRKAAMKLSPSIHPHPSIHMVSMAEPLEVE